MVLVLIFLCISSGVIASIVSISAYRLYQKYPTPYLSSYLIYLFAWNIFSILGLIYLVIAPQFLPKNFFIIVLLSNSILLIPFYGAISYFFLNFIVKLIEKSVNHYLKTAFILIFSLLIIDFMIKLYPLFAKSNSSGIQINNIPFMLFQNGVVYAALLYLFLNLKNINGTMKRKSLRDFGITFIFCYSLYILMVFVSDIGSLRASLLLCLVLFGMNVPSFFVLKRFVNHFYSWHPLQLPDKEKLQQFASTYGVSKREIEIIEKIINGLSNKEIEEELFISLDTVKKHIYNIYKKTKVKNRLQLNFLIQNYKT